MTASKRIFMIGDFKDDTPTSISIERRHWYKGFVRAGYDVQRFSYLNILRQFSLFGSKSIAKKFAHKKTEALLLSQVKSYQPDIVMVLIMKDIRPEIIDDIRRLAPDAHVIGRDVDWLPQNNPERTAIARKMDSLIATNAGQWLQYYKDLGVPRCAFMPCPCDPDIQRPYPQDASLQTDIIFTGKTIHGKYRDLADPDREAILTRLQTMPNASLYGLDGSGRIQGVAAYRAVSNAKIALSINAVNDVPLYHSDRFFNYVSCGTLTLAKRVPDTDLLFADQKHVRYFDSADEFFELANWYLKHDDERKAIAHAGMEHAHREFNCSRIAQLTLDLIENGSYESSWKLIL